MEVEINLPLTIFGVVLTAYGITLAIVAIRNGRILRESVGEFRESTERLIKESRDSTERLIREMHDSLQQSIERIQQSTEAADRRRAEDTKYLAELISGISRP